MDPAPIRPPPETPERSTLSRGERVVLRAIAEAMFSEDGEAPAARLEAHVAEVDAFVSAASRVVRVGLRLALFVVRISPLLLYARARTVERLDVGERVAILSRLERSTIVGLSLAFVGWRAVMTLLFYEDAAELRRLGYPGEERERYKRRLLAAPPPVESGVRLKDDEATAESGREVA